MSLTAVIPVWNGRDWLAGLLTSLAAQTYPASEVLAVDNGSTDGAPDLAREHGARVIAMGRNAGFAAAVNRGIQESQGAWIAVLNSDVELAPDYFEKLMGTGAAFATGKIFSAGSKDRLDATFDAVCRGGTACRIGQGSVDGPIFGARREISMPPWTAVLFRAEVFQRVGFLNEAFESYLEDVEFGLRCAKQGVTGAYVPEAVAWHRGSASLGRWHPEMVRRLSRNQCYLVALHYGWRQAWAIFVAQLLWGGVAIRHGTGAAWLRGKLQGIKQASKLRRNRTGPLSSDWLRENEAVIYQVQQTMGLDWYWRLYFLLTGGAK